MINKVVLKEIQKIQDSDYAKKSDKQLISYEILSELHKGKNMGIQPIAFKIFNENRTSKLSIEKILEIRKRKFYPNLRLKRKSLNKFFWIIEKQFLKNLYMRLFQQ